MSPEERGKGAQPLLEEYDEFGNLNIPAYEQKLKEATAEKIFQVTLGKDIVTAQLEMSCDKIINKILYYLSELPIAESFFCLMPNFKELVAYSRFEDYLNKWF